MTSNNNALQKGDLVLITGGTGWVGSHIVNKALEQGLRVRLAYRDKAKLDKLVECLRNVHGEAASIESVEVKSFESDGAYDEAIAGVQGVIHAASTMSFSDKWDDVVPGVVQGYAVLLQAAHNQPRGSIKRVVLTSSSTSCGQPNVEGSGKPTQHFTRETWNEEAVQQAMTKPDPMNVYSASKTLSEQYAWDFMKQNKPGFTLNTVLPNGCLGGALPGQEYSSTGTWIRSVIFDGDAGITQRVRPQFHIDVDDVGLLHVLGLTRPDVANERILAFGTRFTWNDMIDIGAKIAGSKSKAPPKNDVTAKQDNTTVDVSRTQEILKDHGGLKSLEYSLERNLA